MLVYTEDPIVSSDIVGSPASCTFDALSTMAMGKRRQGHRLVRQRVGVLEPAGRPGRAGRVEAVTLRTLDGLEDVAGLRVFVRVDFNVPHEGRRGRRRHAHPRHRSRRCVSSSTAAPRWCSPRISGDPKGEGPRRSPARAGGRAAGGAARATGDRVGGNDARRTSRRRRGPAGEPAVRPGRGGERPCLRGEARGPRRCLRGRRVRGGAPCARERVGASRARCSRADVRRSPAGSLQREVEVLSTLLHEPARPYVAILGGAKVSDKLATINALVDRVDALLIGGAMAFTLIAADGGAVGDSLVEPDRFDEVRAARARAVERGVPVVLPVDVVAAQEISVDVVASDGRRGSDPGWLEGSGRRSGDRPVVRVGDRRGQDHPVERPDGGLRAGAVRGRNARGRAAIACERRRSAWSAAATVCSPCGWRAWRTRSTISRPAAAPPWSSSRGVSFPASPILEEYP